MYMQAGEFKAKCLKLMDAVQKYGEEIIITKHGKPIAKLVAVFPKNKKGDEAWFGRQKGTVTIVGDITEPIDVEWEAEK